MRTTPVCNFCKENVKDEACYLLLSQSETVKLCFKQENGLNDVKERLNRSDPDAHRRFKGVMEKLRSDCSIYLGTSLNIGAGSGKTKLDQYRIKACKKYMELLRKKAELLKSTTRAENLKTKISLVREEPYKLKNFAKEPQHALPDVIIWMLCDDERVAYHRIPARDLIYNPEPYMVGKNCGKRQTIFLKKPSKRSYGQSGWTVQAKLNMFIWLGVYELSIKRYMDDLPEGYELLHKGDNAALPPIALIYSEHHSYQLRAYMFQARSLIPSDDTGLSDPFARVIFGSQCATTQVIHESLSPTWDETLIMDNIILFGNPEDIKASPPLVIIEIYDHDTLGQPEYLGRVIASPKFNLSQEEYIPPKLEWWDVFRGPHKSGQLLASFEFIQGEESKLPPRPPMKEAKGKVLMNREKKPLYCVPPHIKPATTKHRLEILFRGVRDLKKIQLLTVDHPYVIVECSGQTKQSDRILNIDKSNNFESFLHYIDLDLPEEKIFWPPLTIRCMETRSFGRTLLVGIHTIDNIEEFIYKEKRYFIAPIERQPIEGEDGVDSLGNGQPGTSVAGDVQSRHTAVTSKTAKTTKTTKSVASKQQLEQQQQETKSNVLSGALSWATRITHKTATTVLSETISGYKPGHVTDLLDAGIGLANDKQLSADEPVVVVSGTASSSQQNKEQKKEKELTPEEMDVQRAIHKNLIAELDWWSKYYVSKEDAAREQRLLEKNKLNLNPDGAGDDFGLSIPDYSAINMDDFGRHVQELKRQAIEAEKLKMKKKKKKKFFTRRRMKKKMSKLKGRLNEAFSKDSPGADDGEDGGEESPDEDNSYIQRLKYYTCGLEEVPEFNQFSKFFRTFQLYRGKKSTDEAEDFERFSGLFKGQFCIYKLEDEIENGLTSTDDNGNKEATQQIQPSQQQQQPILPSDDKKSALPNDVDVSQFKLARYLPTNKPVDVKVLVYILKAVDLHPLDMDGRVDPYLILKCGKHVIDDKSNKIDNTLNPLYGRMYEFDAKFPLDSILKIEVWDYDSMSSDDKVGETSIDLEDRYFTHHLAKCAIQQKYEAFGYNTWRNPLKPSELLEKFCLDYGYPKPVYTSGSVWIGKGSIIKFSAESDQEKYEENENGDLRPTIEHLALKALRLWHTIPGGWPLVPEYVESRPLYCEDRPGLTQGHLEMWIDMFPRDCPKLPVTIDISPRIPKSYELRCIVWNTDEVTLDDVNFLTGEASSDIFVKGFIKGVGVDDMKTDIHYRSLTGEGNFNWRFIFKFDYLKAENKVVYKKKDHALASDEVEHKSPPHLSIQIWDADLVTADDFLGSITLDLLKVPRPAKHVNKCSLKMIEDSNYPTLNLFKNKRCKGWWPVAAIEKPENKDDDNYDDDDSIGDENEEQEKLMIKGKVEIELELLTQEEAEKTPVGIGHEEPEAMPKPNRPDTSFLWFMNPLKTLKYIIWKNYKWLLLKLLLLSLLILFLVLFFYNFPGAIVNKILNV